MKINLGKAFRIAKAVAPIVLPLIPVVKEVVRVGKEAAKPAPDRTVR